MTNEELRNRMRASWNAHLEEIGLTALARKVASEPPGEPSELDPENVWGDAPDDLKKAHREIWGGR